MREQISHLLKDRVVKQSNILAGLFLFISLLLIGFTWVRLPPILPVYNQAPWGDPRLAAKPWIFLPPLLCVVYIGINLVLVRIYSLTMPLVARFLAISSILCALLVFIFLIRTFQLIL